MITWLLDGSVLVALTMEGHEHHVRCMQWFGQSVERFASCATTQGTLLRLHLQLAADRSAVAAWKTLRHLVNHPKHEFWEAGFSYLDVPFAGIQGHRQITDAWLAELARQRNGKVATLDVAFAMLNPETVQLVPVF